MKILFCIFILICGVISLQVAAQGKDTLGDPNSFKTILTNSNPGLRYSFNRATYTHNYSGNWDFDGDQKKDSLYFVGDDALHWFHLRIILSSDKKNRDYDWILSEFPLLQSFDHLQETIKASQVFRSFVVSDFNNDGKMSIYIHLDIKVNPIPNLWKRKGVSSSDLLIEYKNKELVIRNFPHAFGSLEK